MQLLFINFSRNLDGLTSKDREVASLRRQIDATSDELTETGRQREVALRENRRLQDDLATMTRENQVCMFNLNLILGFAGVPDDF